MQMSADIRDPQTYAINGAAMEVHRQLVPGLLETAYQEAFAIELAARGIPFQREVPLQIRYKDQVLSCSYRADFVCYGNIIIELKAQSQLTVVDEAQVINYLKITGFQRALLFNFATPSLQYQRFINTGKMNKPQITQISQIDTSQ